MAIEIYADGANLDEMIRLNNDPQISGLTTNPALLKKAGVKSYLDFVKQVTDVVKEKSVSFEVISNNFDEMIRQALTLSSFGKNVFVKIPVVDIHGKSTSSVIDYLAWHKIPINITAIMTENQVISVSHVISSHTKAIISVFAGRVADTQIDPIPLMQKCKRIISGFENQKLLWASSREVLNVSQAESVGCDIITMTPDLINKLNLKNKDLLEYSIETSAMFFGDAKSCGYTL